MSEVKPYIQTLFAGKNIQVAAERTKLFDDFAAEETNVDAVKQILNNQTLLMTKWNLKNRIIDIREQAVSIPNGTVGKPYEAKLDFKLKSWQDISYSDIEGLADLGLIYDNEAEMIKGIPTKSGDSKVVFKFRLNGEPADSMLNEKIIPLVINPDPKSLWKNIDSDPNAKFWKKDNDALFAIFGDKNIVIASKRGRSHANVGSFRDDHFEVGSIKDSGWNIIAVADGAGSAKCSRQGSSIACKGIVEFFSNNGIPADFELLLKEYKDNGGADETVKKINRLLYDNLGKAAFDVYKKLEAFASQNEISIKDLHSTLIFSLVKRFDFGYGVLSFGVGDCPIGMLNPDLSEVSLLNWLDVGEFGGGTRFITMPEIFQDEKFHTRLSFKLVDDFSYLMLMTDGIYDPKFVVEANLEKIEKWKEFLDDLNGNNQDSIKVDFSRSNAQIADQLSSWMDFWSSGNHDDRTLAIIF